MSAMVTLTVKRIPKAERPVVGGVEIGWQWTLSKVDRGDDPAATFTSGAASKQAALDHARDLAAAHGYTPDQIEERISR